MALKLDDKLVIGVSSRALFDLKVENAILITTDYPPIRNISVSMKTMFYYPEQHFH